MKHARVLVAALLARLSSWASWGECPFCERHHDPSEHWPLRDDG